MFTLGIYLDNVLPGQTGVRRPFYFFLLPSYWCGSKLSSKDHDNEEDIEGVADRESYEPVPDYLKRLEEEDQVLKIRNLRKKFGSFTAVDNLNVEMYAGQIFALLGHNGAGKTTAISCLTGMIGKTSGAASAFQMDIFKDMEAAEEHGHLPPAQHPLPQTHSH